MAVNWEIRREGEEAPAYLPDAELFTIRLHYFVGELEGMVGFVDFCCANQMSTLELLSMGTEFGLDVKGCSLWWLDVTSEEKGLKEIKNDLDALTMAESVGSGREVYIYVKLANGASVPGFEPSGCNDEGVGMDQSSRVLLLKGVQEEEDDEEHANLEDILIARHCERKIIDNENDFHDSDYSLSEASDAVDADNVVRPRVEVEIEGEAAGLGSDAEIESDYARSEELESCSSTDEEALDPRRPRYAEFNGEADMKNPQFKIGMKFRSFKQFKDAVKNYGIKNRYVMNFKPNNKKKCKAFCKKGCPFYLWASPMIQDKSTIQIKAGVLEHECARDYNNRHVNAEWIAKNYLEQFRVDPTWKIAGIIQAVKSNQEVDISKLKAYRAKCIAQRLIDGDEESQMARLHDYRLELLKTHPGSTVIVECESVNKRRGRKTMMRRKEVGENIGFTNGKVSKKGVRMTCSICGATGHNKRYHGTQGNDASSSGDIHGKPCQGGHVNSSQQTQLAEIFRKRKQYVEATTEQQTPQDPIQQVIAEPAQILPKAKPTCKIHEWRIELNTRREEIKKDEQGISTDHRQAPKLTVSHMGTIDVDVEALYKAGPLGGTQLRRAGLNTNGSKKTKAKETTTTAEEKQATGPPLSQLITVPIQALHGATPARETQLSMKSLNSRGGNKPSTNETENTAQVTHLASVHTPRYQGKHKDVKARSRAGGAGKRRKV